jgi:hypothetical protein
VTGGQGPEVRLELPAERYEQLVELLGGGHEHDEQVRAAAVEDAHQGRDNGYALGYDVGLGTRPDFAAGLFAGLDAGNEQRRQLARELADRMMPGRRAGRAADREAGQ